MEHVVTNKRAPQAYCNESVPVWQNQRAKSASRKLTDKGKTYLDIYEENKMNERKEKGVWN